MTQKPVPHAINKSLDGRQYPIDLAEGHNRRDLRCAAPTDSIIEAIHRTREEISERFGGSIAAIAEDAARRLPRRTGRGVR
uniref:Uncharacterized protein n=1 Tax=Candidatus Kentrum sp. DK TaxID=2126562 RepID=A0A450TEZ7_9GAMM|nr:MAG: hypothetical protein BECKDK2373C_GA0170839_11355 [Candidatus Kentron sp. DK]